jgi:hypothetical protein
VLDLFSSPLLATSGARCRSTAASAYISHRRPISLHHRLHVCLSAIAAFVSLPVTPSHRSPSSPLLILAIEQFVPNLFKVLLLCIPISSRTGFVVSQLPLLQSSVQENWAHFMLVLCITFNPLAVSGLRVLSLLLPKSPLPLPPELPLHTCGRLAACRPPNTSPPDQSELSILSVEPATCDARARRRHLSPRLLPQHISVFKQCVYFSAALTSLAAAHFFHAASTFFFTAIF